MSGDAPVSAREVTGMLPYLDRIMSADSSEAQDAAIGDALVAWSGEFLNVLAYAAEQDSEHWQPIEDRAFDRFMAWLGGAQLTHRADENERRALAALDGADRAPGLARLAVQALRMLPEDHPLRRERLDAVTAVFLQESQATDDVDERLMALSSLLEQTSDVDEQNALITEGEERLPQATDDNAIRSFRMSAGLALMYQLIDARNAGATESLHALSAHIRQLLEPIVEAMTADDDSYALVISGLACELDDDAGAAVDLYAQALGGQLTDDRRQAALIGILRTGALAERYEPVLQFARETLGVLVLQYTTEPDPAQAAQLREDVDRNLENVATACASTGDLDLLLWALEVSSSARLRHRMSIRSGRSGARIRRLEAALWSAERGLDGDGAADRLDDEGRAAQAVTALSRLREAHRREAEQHRDAIAVPHAADITARIASTDGVAVLGTGRWGTAVLLLHRAPPGQSALDGRILSTGLAEWTDALATDVPPGWAYALGAPWEFDALPGADRRGALERALAAAKDVGSILGEWAAQQRLRRLWLVPHGVLGLIPWWAVDSLRDLDVRFAPCLALLPRLRGAAELNGRAVVIGNATGDLRAADVEANHVARRLRGQGLVATTLSGTACTERDVSAAVADAKVLHFCGHATSEMTESTRSALHLHPEPEWSTPQTAHLLDSLTSLANWREVADGSRIAEVQLPDVGGGPRPGLLREEVLGAVTLRHLEHSQTGTLQAVYVDGQLVRMSELWSAGDMAVSGSLRDLRLAVLSACQSGGSELSFGSDELGGLPAAMMVAGVRSIVCTAWTVDDVLSAVSAELFWESVCSHGDGVVDLYSVVAHVRRALESMDRHEARRRIAALRATAKDGRTRFLFEAAAARVTTDHPFAHPYDWAPLFVIGESRIVWRPA